MRFILVLIAALGQMQAVEIGPSAYQGRRAALKKASSDGAIVLFGRTEGEHDELRSGFYQEPNFYYLTGWTQPGAILLIDPAREILFLPKKNPEAEKWTGPKSSPADANIRDKTGFDSVMASDAFERELRRSLEENARIYALSGVPERAKLSTLAPFAEIKDARMAVAKLRMKKSPEEIALIQHSTDITLAGHRAAWKKAAPGVHEYNVAAVMTNIFLDGGCERHAYAPIVGSGPNSTILHYSRVNRRMDAGEVLLMDVAAECAGYTSDVTRTIPLGGRFTRRQREIYDVVLGAQKAAIAAIKPGVMMGPKTLAGSLNKIAYDYIDARGYGKYFTHGLGHHVGLEVHDAFDPSMPLEAGMIVTIEPGIYIPEENLGVRIEDVVLVTENGAKILSESLPREPGEVEKALGR